MVFDGPFPNSHIVPAFLPVPSKLAKMVHRLFRDGTQRNVPNGLNGRESFRYMTSKVGPLEHIRPRDWLLRLDSFPRKAGRTASHGQGL